MKNKLLSFILTGCLLFPCFFALNACDNKPQEELHTHAWATAWSKNGEEHWYACDGCAEKKDTANHNGNPCVVCGYEQTHTCTYGEYIYDSEYHWQQCSNCEATTSKAEHSFVNKTCTACGYEQAGPAVDGCAVRDLEIITIQAGQGVATLVRLPDGKDMLIDAGDYSAVSEVENLIYTYVEDFTIEYFILTASDGYVCGAAAYIFADFDVLNFYRPSVKSNYETALGLSGVYNSGESPYIENNADYATALEYSSYETGCNIYTIDDTSCDFTYTFRDNENNYHSYTIDFITPIAASNRNNKFDNVVMLSIEYEDKVTLITGYASNNTIDTYCNSYGTQKDVDVLLTYWCSLRETQYAISRSDLRGTNFLEKINLTKEDCAIFAPIAATSGYTELTGELQAAVGFYNNLNVKHEVTTRITATGELTFTAE